VYAFICKWRHNTYISVLSLYSFVQITPWWWQPGAETCRSFMLTCECIFTNCISWSVCQLKMFPLRRCSYTFSVSLLTSRPLKNVYFCTKSPSFWYATPHPRSSQTSTTALQKTKKTRRLSVCFAAAPVFIAFMSLIIAVEPGYNDIGLYDTSSITSDILWYQLIPHC
jgi:hypothetical protein